MLKTNKSVLLSIFILIASVFLVANYAFSQQAESLTITTYYPSPYGSYRNLTVDDRIGVGTTTPDYKIDIETDSVDGLDNMFRIVNGQSTNGFAMRLSAYPGAANRNLWVSHFDGNLNLESGENYSVRVQFKPTPDTTIAGPIFDQDESYFPQPIRAGDNIGIDTDTPGQALTIHDGQILFQHTGDEQFESGRIRFTEFAGTSYRGGYIHYDGLANLFHIGVHNNNDQVVGNDNNAITMNRGTGNVGIGIDTPDVELDVNGMIECDLDFSSSGVVNVGAIAGGGNGGPWKLIRSSSSKRYKKNIKDLSFGLDLIQKLRPVSFNWKKSGTHDIGLIAEEVEKIAPILVTYFKDKVESVRYAYLSPILINAIKELKAENDALKAANESLEARIATIERKINNLSK